MKKVSPIMDTLVLALEEAAANISAKCPESLADKPKAVRASVTISDVVARSSPDAAARLMMPSMPSNMSPVFQPAMVNVVFDTILASNHQGMVPALVECDGHYMLIDGGNKADSNVIYSVLRNANVPKLDIVVGTHAHVLHRHTG